MGQITKPDTNPYVPAVLNLVLVGGGGYFMLGQQKKGVIAIICTVVFACMGIGLIIPLITAYDAYLLGEKLKTGQSIGENENGLEFLNAVFK